ncbi:acyl-CoA dehydrogenase family protein [Pajaroellobacter abortibovis]|uniref:Acyl-CoA dehydrogenase n=1 Tax=Pajaroellobacter abortibovis TaxID=1882918 RepID=A0A1L6MW66_9BACT|nr:acyl-CoA dehydrogenase family protein [Pajaroellobacter abortibovis]APR99678.1 acyl-CoA dehydrogenase [Pajaroellobacter abortibovis]
MDFHFSEEYALLRQAVRDFSAVEIAPYASMWDQEERFPHELVPKLAKMGLLGICIPPEYGGVGLNVQSYALCVEEIAKVDGSSALFVASHNGLAVGHVLAFGTEAQKERFLPKAASGEYLAAWALTEPGSGSDAAALTTTAKWEDGAWVLSGTKMFITQGCVCGFCVVLARTNPHVAKQKGITAFLIERGTPGFYATKQLKKLGCRSSDTAELVLDRVRVPDSCRLGEVDCGFSDATQILAQGRISIAAMALGLGYGAFESASKYASQRIQFGKPIGDFGVVQCMLAESKIDLEASHLLTYRAAWLADQKRPCMREASMAKLFASEAATRICHRSLQIHGGYGYSCAFSVERHLRDAKLCEIGEGTSEVQRMLIGRQYLGMVRPTGQ